MIREDFIAMAIDVRNEALYELRDLAEEEPGPSPGDEVLASLERLLDVCAGAPPQAATRSLLTIGGDARRPTSERIGLYGAFAEAWSLETVFGRAFEKRRHDLENAAGAKQRRAERTEALARFEADIAQTSDLEELMRVAEAEAQNDETERQLAALTRRVEVERSPHTLVSLGAALRRAGRIDAAARTLDESLGLDPSKQANRATWIAKVALLRTHATPQSLGQARALGRELLELAPKDPYLLSALGGVESDLGHLSEAQRLLEAGQAVARHKRGPADVELRKLQRAYQARGDLSAAARVARALTRTG